MHPENAYKDAIKVDCLPSLYPSVTSQYPPGPPLFSPFLPYFKLVLHISFFSMTLIALATKAKVIEQEIIKTFKILCQRTISKSEKTIHKVRKYICKFFLIRS